MANTPLLRIGAGNTANCLWNFGTPTLKGAVPNAPPQFEIDGAYITASVGSLETVGDRRRLPNGAHKYRFRGFRVNDPDLTVEIVFRVAEESSIVRFRYILTSQKGRCLTRSQHRDYLEYLSLPIGN